jgi:hypothetical protein
MTLPLRSVAHRVWAAFAVLAVAALATALVSAQPAAAAGARSSLSPRAAWAPAA